MGVLLQKVVLYEDQPEMDVKKMREDRKGIFIAVMWQIVILVFAL